jgi:hypothetical protein
MTIIVRLTDDTGGVTKFTIPTPVQVKANETLAALLMDQILYADTKSLVNTQLFSGDLRSTAQVMSSLTAMLNSQSYGDKQNLVSSSGGSGGGSFVTTYGPDRNVSFSANFDTLKDVTPQYAGFTPVSKILIIKLLKFWYQI